MARSQLVSNPFLYTDVFKVDFPGGVIEPGAAQDYMEESSDQNYILGMRGRIFGDDRIYRYGQAAATAIVVGALVSPDVSAIGVIDTDNIVDAAEAIGQTVVKMDGTGYSSIVANQFAGGIFGITGDTGAGHGYPIGANTASANTDEVDLTLLRPIRVALDTTSDTMIMPLPFDNLVIADATDGFVVGVTPLAITASYYFWIQRRGRAVVLVEAAAGTTLWQDLTMSDSTAGSCQDKDAHTEVTIGFCIVAGDATGHAGVYLTLE